MSCTGDPSQTSGPGWLTNGPVTVGFNMTYSGSIDDMHTATIPSLVKTKTVDVASYPNRLYTASVRMIDAAERDAVTTVVAVEVRR